MLGGPASIRDSFPFEEMRHFISEMMGAYFIEEMRYYFDQCSQEDDVKSKYSCHLDSLKAVILHSIYSTKEW